MKNFMYLHKTQYDCRNYMRQFRLYKKILINNKNVHYLLIQMFGFMVVTINYLEFTYLQGE